MSKFIMLFLFLNLLSLIAIAAGTGEHARGQGTNKERQPRSVASQTRNQRTCGIEILNPGGQLADIRVRFDRGTTATQDLRFVSANQLVKFLERQEDENGCRIVSRNNPQLICSIGSYRGSSGWTPWKVIKMTVPSRIGWSTSFYFGHPYNSTDYPHHFNDDITEMSRRDLCDPR